MRIQKQFSFKSEQQYQKLVSLAQKHEFPSVSGLVQAIASGEMSLELQATTEQQQALVEAVLSLRDAGEFTATSVMAQLLLERGLLAPALRSRIDDSFTLLFAPWRQQIEQYVNLRQSFKLSYSDAAGRIWVYTVRSASFCFREKRTYLECWCEETEGNQDIPELQHNWTLRLDRISNAGIVPISGEWRNQLDTVEVEFELFGGLAHAYQERKADIEPEWLSLEPPRKRVVRRISNTFWFVREILPYGKDCVVRSPQVIRQKVREHLENACILYK